MKIKLFLLGLGLCACTSVWAQSPKATKVKTVGVEELKEAVAQEGFLVDEAALEVALKKLAVELKAKKAQKSKEQMQLLRYQMLINLLSRRAVAPQVQQAPQQAPVVININNNGHSEKQVRRAPKHHAKKHQKVQDKETLLLKKRLAYLEARLKAVELKDAKEAKAKQQIVIHQKSVAERHRLDSLEQRLKMLTAESKKLDEELEAPSKLALVETADGRDTIVLVDTVKLVNEVVNRQDVLVPVDFQREVFFVVNSTKLTPQAKVILDDVVRFMGDYPKAKLEISGYASADGSREANLRLARRRQASVRAYLEAQGISANHFVGGTPSIDRDVVAEALGRKVVIKLLQ